MTAPLMKAAILDAHREPFRIAATPRPNPGPGQVLVRIHASGVNPLDTKIHEGAAAHAKHNAPAILGLDMAGTIEVLGGGVDQFREGDEVYGMVGGVGGLQGTLAEYISVSADLLAAKPANLSMREAAALPLIAITAWEGLVDRADVSVGETVLVQGGGGGVGHVAIQIARAFGAKVYAVDGAAKRAFVEGLGATFIDREEEVESYVLRHAGGAGFDLIYDTIGGSALDASFKAVRHFGRVVSSYGWGTHSLAPLSFRAATYSGVFTLLPLLTGKGQAHHGEILRQVARFVEEGKLTPRLDPRRFTLESAYEAYRLLKTRAAQGKLVVDIAR